MKHTIIPLLALACMLTACAGIDIRGITPEQAADAHTGQFKGKGYIVYSPVVMVEIGMVCVDKDANGACKKSECVARTPFVVPDHGKPFLVNVKAGLGKAGADIAITNGWQLGSMKDTSDNTAILGLVAKAVGLERANAGATASAAASCTAGLYSVRTVNGNVTLEKEIDYSSR